MMCHKLNRCRRLVRRDALERAMSLTALVVFIVLGLSPRGIALCISDEHSWGDTLAGWCSEHQIHHHGGTSGHAEHDGHGHRHGHGSGHSHGHDHGPHTDPCFDLPLGLEEFRPQEDERPDGTRLALRPADERAVVLMAWLDDADNVRSSTRFRSREGPIDASVPAQMRGMLRAVVLQI